MNKHRTLLGIIIYEIDSDFLYEFRNSRLNSDSIFKDLPKYTFGNDGNIINSEYYLQYTGLDKEENKKFILFETKTHDDNMYYEINELGEENILNEFSDDLREIIRILPKTNVEDFKNHCYDKINYLVIDIFYNNYGSNDIDSVLGITYDLVGYLNSEMKLIKR